jgi:peptide/nickel transport system substrate-binding protein
VVYANVFEGLTRFAPDGSVIPGLAESWEISEDGTDLHLHPARGRHLPRRHAMTAEDVVFSSTARGPRLSTNAQKALFAGIESVEAVDDTTVVVTLDAPDGAFPFKMAWGDAVIVAPESADTNATNPVGTGPFRFSEWVQGDRVELVRNDDYWGEPVALEAATFRFISDPNAAFAAMMAGDVDAFPNFPAPETLAQFEADPRFTVIVGSTEGETILAMNNAGEPLTTSASAGDQPRDQPAGHHRRRDVRLWHAHRHAFRAAQSRLRRSDRQLRLRPRRRPARLLAEAGVEGLTLRLMLPPPSYARRGGEIIAAQLREVGIETEITNMEWAAMAGAGVPGQGFRPDHRQPYRALRHQHLRQPDYYFQYDNPDFQALNAELEVTSDPAERSAPGADADDDRGGLRQRLPVPAGKDRRGQCQYRGAVGELADAGQ